MSCFTAFIQTAVTVNSLRAGKFMQQPMKLEMFDCQICHVDSQEIVF